MACNDPNCIFCRTQESMEKDPDAKPPGSIVDAVLEAVQREADQKLGPTRQLSTSNLVSLMATLSVARAKGVRFNNIEARRFREVAEELDRRIPIPVGEN